MNKSKQKISILIGLFIFISLFSNGTKAFTILPVQCGSSRSQCIQSEKLEWIFIYSEIIRSDASFFIDLDTKWPSDKPFPLIWVVSPGGDVDAAITIGRILRKRSAIILSGNPLLGVDHLDCSSACVLLAAGAVERHIKFIGLHAPHYVKDNGRNGKSHKDADDSLKDQVKSYFLEMGIDQVVIDLILKTPPEDLRSFMIDPQLDPLDQDIVRYGFYKMISSREPLPNLPASFEGKRKGLEEEFGFAAYNGDLTAAHMLSHEYEIEGSGRKPNYQKAEYWLQFAVDRGDTRAMHNMAVALEDGHWGKRDQKKAVELYKRASLLGSASAQNNLGWHYYTGHGVKRNIPHAVYWITQSAFQGTNFAYGSLCEMHGNGDVFERDNISAYVWCDLAMKTMPKGKARGASVKAMTKISTRMSQTEIDEAIRRSKEWKPLVDKHIYMTNKEDW